VDARHEEVVGHWDPVQNKVAQAVQQDNQENYDEGVRIAVVMAS
jgi:hypothetical protein